MLARAGFPSPWGFKLPESMLVLDLIAEAFPRARYVHLVRDPLATCLRRTHMTSRLDNEIGQAAVVAAYRQAGRPLSLALEDSPAVRMAYTTSHQLGLALDFARKCGEGRWLEMRFEALLAAPRRATERLAAWLEREPTADSLEREVDQVRAASPSVVYPEAEAAAAAEVLTSLRARLGYASPDGQGHSAWT
jgi:Sulfotransferase family